MLELLLIFVVIYQFQYLTCQCKIPMFEILLIFVVIYQFQYLTCQCNFQVLLKGA